MKEQQLDCPYPEIIPDKNGDGVMPIFKLNCDVCNIKWILPTGPQTFELLKDNPLSDEVAVRIFNLYLNRKCPLIELLLAKTP